MDSKMKTDEFVVSWKNENKLSMPICEIYLGSQKTIMNEISFSERDMLEGF